MRRKVIASVLGALALLLAAGAGTAAAASPGVQTVSQSAGNAQQATSASGRQDRAEQHEHLRSCAQPGRRRSGHADQLRVVRRKLDELEPTTQSPIRTSRAAA